MEEKMKYTSLYEILYRTIRDYGLDIDEATASEYAAEAISNIGIYGVTQKKFSIEKVYNHIADLPNDLMALLQVVYISGFNVDCLCDSTNKLVQVIKRKKVVEYRGCSQVEAVCNDIIYINEPDSSAISFYPIRKSTTTVWKQDCCEDIEDKYNNYQYIEGVNTLKFSFSDGIVGIGYYGVVTDDKGLVMIPDYESVKEAISKYILYKYFQKKFYTTDNKGIQIKFQKAEYDWLDSVRRARSDVMMPSIDDMQNIYEDSINPFFRERYYQYFSTVYKPVVDKRNVYGRSTTK